MSNRLTYEELEQKVKKFKKKVTEFKRAEKILRKRTYDLNERVRELDCLYNISKLVEKPGISLHEILQGTVNLIPHAWQYPEITCSRIILEDQEFKNENFRETRWKQSSDIIVHGERMSTLEVYYLEERPASDEGPFLKEEKNLLTVIAEQLGKIIQRKQTEADLRKTSDYLENLFNYANAPIIVWDSEGRITQFNHAFERLTGYTANNVIGQKLVMLFPEASCDESLSKIERTVSGEYWKSVEIPILCKDGDNRVALWNSANIFADDGITVIATIAQGQDITERVQIERELMLKDYAIASSINAIVFTDLEGNLTYINNSFLKMWRYDNEKDVLGKNVVKFWETEKEAEGIIQTLYDKGGYVGELAARKKDGSIFHVQISASLVKDETGKPICMMASFVDITEEKKLRKESDYRLQQIIQADKLASLGEMVAGVVHEINNPNSFITYNIPLLEESWQIFEPILDSYAATHPEWRKNGLSFKELSQDMGEIIKAIKTGSKRINRVVANLKDFARLNENNHFKPVQVNEAIEKTLSIIGAQLRKSVGKVEVNLASNLPEIEGHLQKLEQVVANLVINATQAIPEKDKGRISITTQYLESLNHVSIKIEDNGRGMDPLVKKRIFEPFFSTRRDNGGTGLGLSVSLGLIKEHNGVINVLSRPGLGSQFTVLFPVDRNTKLDLHPSTLCVDNDVGFLKELTHCFTKVNGNSFKTTSNPKRVMACLEEHPEVDIVLARIMMPGVNGWELLEQVKKRFPLLTVILYMDHSQVLKQKPNGHVAPDYLLQKPFEPEQLLEIINNIDRQML